jgi:hypothetical protein
VKDLQLRALIARGMWAFVVVWLVIVAIAVGATYLIGSR